MPILSNPRHERFAQELAKGKSAIDAYRLAGFNEHRQNAHRLMTNDDVSERVAEIQSKGAERAEITVAMVLAELARIGFSDIRKVVQWSGSEIADEVDGEDGDGGEPRLIIRAANIVRLISSDVIDDNTAACISEVSQTKEGSLKIKLHDKRAALVDIGRHLGMFKDVIDINHHHDVTDEPLSDTEWAEQHTTQH